jgi:uncharacterized integral membrane protein
MRVIYTVIVILLMLFVITFSQENVTPVQLKYYDIINVTLPAYMLMFMSFLIAVIFTGFMGIVERFRLTRTTDHLNKTIRELKRELRDIKKPQVAEEPDLPAGDE